MSEWQDAMRAQVEEAVSKLPQDPAVLIRLIEQRYLLELIAWDICPEWVALKRAIPNANSYSTERR